MPIRMVCPCQGRGRTQAAPTRRPEMRATTDRVLGTFAHLDSWMNGTETIGPFERIPDMSRRTGLAGGPAAAGGTLVLKLSTALATRRGGSELAATMNGTATVTDSLTGLPVVPRLAGTSTISGVPSGGLLGQLPCALARTTLLGEIASLLNSLHGLFGSVSFEGALILQPQSLAGLGIRLRRPCRLSY